MKKKTKFNSGLSLLEILVAIGAFAVLGIIVTRSILFSVKGTQKGELTIKARETIDYAIAVIERQLRNAESVIPCPNPVSTTLSYYDNAGDLSEFSCNDLNAQGYLASGSARLTNSDIDISDCSFTCIPGSASTPPQVEIDIASGGITFAAKIDLRTY
jgi:type II secretory pathway pseudopilin PulG